MADTKRGNAIYANDIAAIAPVSLNDRIDAQNANDVPIASNDAIRGLYRPVTMLVIVVGNVKADSTRALIDKWFGGWRRTQLTFFRARSPPLFRRDHIRPVSFSALAKGVGRHWRQWSCRCRSHGPCK
jgi:hypothetical protein